MTTEDGDYGFVLMGIGLVSRVTTEDGGSQPDSFFGVRLPSFTSSLLALYWALFHT